MEKRIDNSKEGYNKAYEDMVSNKIMITIVVGFVALGILMFLYKNFGTAGKTANTYQLTYILTAVSSVFTVIIGGWFAYNKKAGNKEALRAITSANCLKAGLMFTMGFGFICKYDTRAIKVLYILVPAYVGLYFIHKVYAKDFFAIAAVGSYSIMALYVLKSTMFTTRVELNNLALGGLAVMTAISLILCVMVQKNKGKLSIGKFKLRLNARANYALIYIGIALPVICVALAYSVGIVAVEYGVFAVGGYLVACTLYYTYQLMNS